MKTALAFLLISILVLLFLWSKTDIFFGRSTVDIHVHDTYFVIDRLQFILFIVLILGTLSSLGGVIGTRFRSKVFLIAFLSFLAADAYVFYPLLELID
jgi:heme/copper-type cytochrome/quinol oxidase subunit 1